jgi:hypothetical protein
MKPKLKILIEKYINIFFDLSIFIDNNETMDRCQKYINEKINLSTKNQNMFSDIYLYNVKRYNGSNKKEAELACKTCFGNYYHSEDLKKLIDSELVRIDSDISPKECYDCMTQNIELIEIYKNTICYDCKERLNYENDGSWLCYRCDKYLCECCSEEISDIHPEINDDLIKKINIVCLRYSSEVVCEHCLTDIDIKNIIDDYLKEQEYYEISNGISDREEELILALNEIGLRLRDDSKYCRNYINNNIGNIQDIVIRMAQMKYLYEVLNFKETLDEVSLEYDEILDSGYIPDFNIFSEAERIILEKNNGYPDNLLVFFK